MRWLFQPPLLLARHPLPSSFHPQVISPFPSEIFLLQLVLYVSAGIPTLKSNGRISHLRRQLSLGSSLQSFSLLYKYPFGNLDDCLCSVYIVLYQSSIGAGKSRSFLFLSCVYILTFELLIILDPSLRLYISWSGQGEKRGILINLFPLCGLHVSW